VIGVGAHTTLREQGPTRKRGGIKEWLSTQQRSQPEPSWVYQA